MGINDEVSLLSGSDHVAVRVDIWVEQMENQRKNVQSKVRQLILHQERDLKVAKSIMDKAFDECNWDGKGLDEKMQSFPRNRSVSKSGSVWKCPKTQS